MQKIIYEVWPHVTKAIDIVSFKIFGVTIGLYVWSQWVLEHSKDVANLLTASSAVLTMMVTVIRYFKDKKNKN